MSGPAWEDPRRVLARHGLRPSRRFSQNFLVSEGVVERIAEALGPAEGERVVELGPGAGTLTAALLRRGARVLALEMDRRMLGLLEAELGEEPGLELREGDAAALDLAELGLAGPVAVCGNLPYAVTGAIFRRLVAQRERVDRAVLMIQREVRDRLLAEPGTKAYGALTVFTTAAFAVEPVMLVKPGAFHPPPKVTSAVLRLRPAPWAEETPAFRAVVSAAFEKRRKTLRNALGALAPREVLDPAFEAVGIDPRRRGETLSVEEFAALAATLEPALDAR
ncbi:MAG TPA: 16S rRNA (adenine(1518)-N(6)/adenine(1519)-N(6))-dimethyltransferase RsmA [Polyangiaceae bacterium LLY-WYZ-15_(1-7)]|nr:16S rRNA (adenine(1518)-N(6)/adenine(1519)-N(6))-dimethyltransferase RsmA [Polyangiaceae bacterium LLY-WYZ-15_(1-7)]